MGSCRTHVAFLLLVVELAATGDNLGRAGGRAAGLFVI
jgi:hypothetical protein